MKINKRTATAAGLKHPRKPSEQERVIRGIAVGAGSFFLLVVGFMAWNLPENDDTAQHSSWQNLLAQRWRRQRNKGAAGKRRIAMLLPFVGEGPESVPPYLNLFCRGARAASDVADFFLIHNGVLEHAQIQPQLSFCHSNVILVNLQSTQAMAERLLRVLDRKAEDSWQLPRDKLLSILLAHLRIYPYTLVEYKPAYGYLFQDLVQEDVYSHWGYSDLDMVYGDLGRHIEDSEWDDFDIVTFGFGDQQRLYVKGQFTLHRNEESLRQLWRECEHLSDLDQRFASWVNEENGKSFQLESAEGCYPASLLQNKNISIKFAVKAWTDVSETDTAYSHGLYMFQNPRHPHKHILAKQKLPKYNDDVGEPDNDADTDQVLLDQLPLDWFHKKDAVYKDHTKPLQVPAGAMEPLPLPSETNTDEAQPHCMYWVQPKYQKHLCLSQPVSATENVFWVKGKLYKQAFSKVRQEDKTGVDTGPFFHFQEWKRRFRFNQLSALNDPAASVSVLTPEGGIVVSTTLPSRLRRGASPQSPLGIGCERWDPQHVDGEFDSTQLPSHSYCLSGKVDQFQFRVACTRLVTWRENVRLLSTAPGWKQFSSDLDVTLVQVVQIHGQESLKTALSPLVENLKRWKGQPSLVLIYVTHLYRGLVAEVQSFITRNLEEAHLDSCLLGLLTDEVDEKKEKGDSSESVISQKSLQNMAIDAVPTRWYLSGLNLDGTGVEVVILSPDTVHLARRKSASYQSTPGNVFLLPKFEFMDKSNGWNLSDLMEAKENHRLHVPSDFDACDGSEEPQDSIMVASTLLWWQQTRLLLDDADAKKGTTDHLPQLAESLQEMEYRLAADLVAGEDGGLEEFMSSPQTPLMLIDNVLDNPSTAGQHRYGHILAREVEEFAGGRCGNVLRLAQMVLFGYNLNVLEGAFAASTLKVDDSTNARCRGCVWLEESDGLRNKILEHEVVRPAIARSLWERRYQ